MVLAPLLTDMNNIGRRFKLDGNTPALMQEVMMLFAILLLGLMQVVMELGLLVLETVVSFQIMQIQMQLSLVNLERHTRLLGLH